MMTAIADAHESTTTEAIDRADGAGLVTRAPMHDGDDGVLRIRPHVPEVRPVTDD